MELLSETMNNHAKAGGRVCTVSLISIRHLISRAGEDGILAGPCLAFQPLTCPGWKLVKLPLRSWVDEGKKAGALGGRQIWGGVVALPFVRTAMQSCEPQSLWKMRVMVSSPFIKHSL